MQTLREIYNSLVSDHAHNVLGEMVTTFSDKGTMHSYIEYYEKWFEPHRAQSSILEIGVMTGGSALLWQRYFDSVVLAGVDLRNGFNKPLPFQATICADWHWAVDSTDPQQVPELDQFQFVIDDGAHDEYSQIKTFQNYWQFVQPGGTYFIEDIESDASTAVLKEFVNVFVREPHTVDYYRGHAHREDDRILAITKGVK